MKKGVFAMLKGFPFVRSTERYWTVGFKTIKGIQLEVVVQEWSAKGAVASAQRRQVRLKNDIREVLYVKEWA